MHHDDSIPRETISSREQVGGNEQIGRFAVILEAFHTTVAMGKAGEECDVGMSLRSPSIFLVV
jgi:hypothetical protein